MTERAGAAAERRPPPENRVVTGYTLSFAILSAVASLTPLFAETFGIDVARGLDRGSSLAWYAAAMLAHFGLVLPGAFSKAPGTSLRPFAALVAFSALFASLPAAVAAYVSGVRAENLFALAAAPAAVAAGALFCRATFGARATVVFGGVFLLVAFLLPGAALAFRAVGAETPLDAALDASPTVHVWRLATRREAGGAIVWWCVAAAFSLGAAFSVLRRGRKSRGRARGAAASFAVVVVAAGVAATAAFVEGGSVRASTAPQATAEDLSIAARAGSATRAGARTPLRVVAPRGEGVVELLFEAGTLVVPRDGAPQDVCVVLTRRETDVGVRIGGDLRRVALPTAPLDPATALIGAATTDGGAEVARLVDAPPSGCVVVDLGDLRGLSAGELEAFDALAVGSRSRAAAAVLDAFVAQGGIAVELGAPPTSPRAFGEGRRLKAATASDVDFAALRRRPADAFDPALRSLFVRPDWARVDLKPLALFLVLYHVAFLAAFLLPWRLDAKKSSNVYLVSTGFVVVVVVFGGRAALKSFFFKDNQVATQCFTAATIVANADGPPVASLRQWRLFASMSGERRTLPVPSCRDGVVYRDRNAAPLRFETGPFGERVVDAPLDRFAAMTLLREDRFGASPIEARLETRADGLVARLSPRPDVDDPAGLRFARPRRAWFLDGAAPAREGRRLPDGGFAFAAASSASPPGAAAEPPPEVRAVVARATPHDGAASGRRVVFLVDGVRRLDDASSYFFVEDRGAALVFDVAP